ncbi:MAG: MarR family transcriptional regulator [Flavobacteriales bacterium]|nr:MarR family transcriptional regulator [Flavobacteriales bacterium]MCB9175113.1 MarR family transcriptional regulator [Flavobacteriales bacterium]
MNQNTIDYQIKSTWHGIFKMYNQVAAKHGSTQAAGYFLLTISKEGTPATSIAPLMGMEATSMSRIIKSMEDKGLIFRKQDEKDKRMVRIFLTPEGVEKRKLAKKVVEGFNDLILEEIPQSKLHVFFEVMDTINKTIEKYKQEN